MPGASAVSVLQQYLSDKETGLVSVLQRALQQLYSQDSLPHNPFFQLAALVAAYSDQGGLWPLTDPQVGAAVDAQCSVELIDPDLHLARLANTNACGLPHVLRCVTTAGINAMRDVLGQSLPSSFFPPPAPTADADDYITQVLPSLQGPSICCQPSQAAVLALEVRADVAIRGRSLDAALQRFLAQVVQDLRDLLAAGPHQILSLQACPGLNVDAAAEVAEFAVEGVLAEDNADLVKQLKLLVAKQCYLRCQLLLAVNVPPGAGREATQQPQPRFAPATKLYYLHFGAAPGPGLPPSTYQSFGSLAHEALLGGAFLEAAALEGYLALAPSLAPYSALDALVPVTVASLPAALQSGRSPHGWLHLLHLVLVQDEQVVGGPGRPAGPMMALQDLLDPHAGRPTGADPLTAVAANLFRLLRSPAVDVMSLAEEVHALQGALSPLIAGLALEDEYEVEAEDVAARQRLQAHLAAHLASLPARIRRALDGRTHQSFASCADHLLRQMDLRSLVGVTDPASWRQLASCLVRLAALLEGCAATAAKWGLLRCLDVQRLLIQLQVDLQVEPLVVDGDTASWEQPGWVVHVPKVAQARFRNGSLAQKVSREGVMLQYAVDTGLDAVLADMFGMLTEPPLPRNPFPAVARMLTAQAWRLELHITTAEDRLQALQNQLVKVDSASFMYEASAPPAARAANEQQDGRQAKVYGTYAAVAMVDAHALQQLRQRLPQLLSGCSWQQGAYQVEMVPALSGDACLSRSLGLELPDRLTGSGPREAGPGPSSQRAAAYMHARAWDLRGELHYLVSGPALRAAAKCFAESVLTRAADIQQHSLHLLASLRVTGSEQTWAPGDLVARRSSVLRMLQSRAKACADCFSPVAEAVFYIAVPEGVYLPFTQRIYFAYQPLRGSALPGQHWGSPHARTGQLGAAGRWDTSVYQRVFLQAQEATAWASWYRALGDPGHPFHTAHAAACLREQAEQLADEGDPLLAVKLQLTAALAEGDALEAARLACACRSDAQELGNLEIANRSLERLLDWEQALSAPADGDRMQSMLILYLNRLTRLVASPKQCPFPGLAFLITELTRGLALSMGQQDTDPSGGLPLLYQLQAEVLVDMDQHILHTHVRHKGLALTQLEAVNDFAGDQAAHHDLHEPPEPDTKVLA
ncbi:hypothetical protein WJX72_000269 [[Myrmecia] bisecta]|uniref:Uncharacterized protein n=1 Tax=[Myrmecia] bisecta TaxID=41462 RepID=A0AAW1Q3M8_9CHLO